MAEEEGDDELLRIARTPAWKATHAAAAALRSADDVSLLALACTSELIALNVADYSAWGWRWRCVAASGPSPVLLRSELSYTAALAGSAPKSYQLWNHRRLVAGAIGSGAADGELSFTAQLLAGDAKNYHAWAHRGWAVRAWSKAEGERVFTGEHIAADARNASAWHARFAALSSAGLLRGTVLAEEAAFAAEKVGHDPHNRAARAYAEALHRLVEPTNEPISEPIQK